MSTVFVKITEPYVKTALDRLKSTGVGLGGLGSWVVVGEKNVDGRDHYVFNKFNNADYILVPKEKPEWVE